MTRLLLVILAACSLEYDLPDPGQLGIPRLATAHLSVACHDDPEWFATDLGPVCTADAQAWAEDISTDWTSWAHAACEGSSVRVEYHDTAIPCDPEASRR